MPERRSTRYRSRSARNAAWPDGGSFLFRLCQFDGFEDNAAGIFCITPASDADPFFGLQVFVMGKEMLDLLHDDLRQVAAFANRAVIREGRIKRHAKQFFIAAMFVFKVQHRDRTTTHYTARHEWRARDDQSVEWITIGGQGMRNESVICGVAHRRVQDTIHEQRAGFLVKLIFDRLTANGHFDNHVQGFRRIVADSNFADVHVSTGPDYLVFGRKSRSIPRSVWSSTPSASSAVIFLRCG